MSPIYLFQLRLSWQRDWVLFFSISGCGNCSCCSSNDFFCKLIVLFESICTHMHGGTDVYLSILLYTTYPCDINSPKTNDRGMEKVQVQFFHTIRCVQPLSCIAVPKQSKQINTETIQYETLKSNIEALQYIQY